MGLQQIPSKGGIPSGNTASRPGSPVIGDTYYDGTVGFLMIFDGTNFIPCSAPASQPTIAVTDVGTNVAYETVQASVAFTEGITGGKANGFTAIQGSVSSTSTSSPIVLTITGTPGSYNFSGTSYNGFGTSPSSLTVSQSLTSVPQAPTIGTLSNLSNDGQLSLTFTAGATGGKSISNYKYSIDNGSTYTAFSPAQTTSPLTISGLTNGTSYTVRLKAVNANGDSNTSTASNAATPTLPLILNYLVVAGGGGGGTGGADGGDRSGGGGGGGGLRSTVTATGGGGSLETALSLAKGINYTVTVGGGGTGANAGGAAGSGGTNSVFSTITATGGGGGGRGSTTSGLTTGGNGGSSGGGGALGSGGTSAGTRTASPVQGYNGGTGGSNSGGGGGGAGAEGQNSGGSDVGGNGGNGAAVSITDSSVTYAGGGAGGDSNGATGGTGGGGASNGTTVAGTAGTVNTGGGGGAGYNPGAGGGAGGNGGKGVVILRWLTADATITVGAGLTADATGTDGSYSYKRFTDGSGNVSFA
jgi:hypothetical protein